MAKVKYARVRFQIRRENAEIIGQRRTMRGVNYNKNQVVVPLEGRKTTDLKMAIIVGVGELYRE